MGDYNIVTITPKGSWLKEQMKLWRVKHKKNYLKYNFSVSRLSLSFSTFIALVPPKACSYNYLSGAP